MIRRRRRDAAGLAGSASGFVPSSKPLSGFARIHPDLIAVFREGQYRFFEYERRLVSIYQQSLAWRSGRDMGLPEYLFALGGVRFCSIRSALQGVRSASTTWSPSSATAFFAACPSTPPGSSAAPRTRFPLPWMRTRAGRLLYAGKTAVRGEGLFRDEHPRGDRRRRALRRAPSTTTSSPRKSFSSEIIRRVGHDVRAFIARNLPASDGAAAQQAGAELRGLWLWLVYLSIDKDCYAIVREAEFVLPGGGAASTTAISSTGYRKNPEGNGDADQANGHRVPPRHRPLLRHRERHSTPTPSNARAAVETIGGYLSHGFSDWID